MMQDLLGLPWAEAEKRLAQTDSAYTLRYTGAPHRPPRGAVSYTHLARM